MIRVPVETAPVSERLSEYGDVMGFVTAEARDGIDAVVLSSLGHRRGMGVEFHRVRLNALVGVAEAPDSRLANEAGQEELH